MGSPTDTFDARARAQTARWLQEWDRRGQLLDDHRVAELRVLTEDESARIAVALLWSAHEVGRGDDGAGLRPMLEALQRLSVRA